MRLRIVSVGRARRGAEQELYEHYLDRLPWPVELKEVVAGRSLPAVERCRREGEALLAAVPAEATLVVLDERGAEMTSAAFAALVAAWTEAGVRDVAFVIGGADGLDAAVRKRADRVLSLGPMTWPHLLVRVLLAEQLYRAASILAGHPYHRAGRKR